MKNILQRISLNYLFILYAFFIPLSLDLLRACAILITIVWIGQSKFHHTFHAIGSNHFFQAFGLLLSILLFSLLWTDPAHLLFGIKYITRYWYLLPMFAIYTSIDRRFISFSLSAFLSGMFLSEIISYGIFFELLHFGHIHKGDPSPFMHHTLYSVFLVLTAGILLNRIFTSASLRHKIVYALFFTTVTSNLFLNSGRTGQFLFGFILLLVSIQYYKLTIKSLFLTFSFLCITLYLAFSLSPNYKSRMLQTYDSLQTISYDTPIGSRIGLNIVAKDIFLEHPLLGVGVGDYLSEKAKMITKKYPDREYVKSLAHYHNQYAEFTVIAGLFGLFSYLLLLASLFNIPIKDRRLHTVKLILVSTIAIASLSDAIFHLNRPLSLFALFAGLLLAQSRYEEYES